MNRVFELIEKRRVEAEAVRVEVRDAFVAVISCIGDVVKEFDDRKRVAAIAALNTALTRFGVLLPPGDAALEGIVNSTGAMAAQVPHEPEVAVMLGALRKHVGLWYRRMQSAEQAHQRWIADVAKDLKARGRDDAVIRRAWEQGSGIPWPGPS